MDKTDKFWLENHWLRAERYKKASRVWKQAAKKQREAAEYFFELYEYYLDLGAKTVKERQEAEATAKRRRELLADALEVLKEEAAMTLQNAELRMAIAKELADDT